MEIYYEKNVVNDGIDKHKKRNIILNIVKIVAIVWLVIASFIFINFVDFSANGWIVALISILFLFAPPICLLIFANRLIANLNLEYDYYILGDRFRIMKVINRRKRKLLIEIPTSSIAVVGMVESESFDRYANDNSVKQVSVFCSETDLLYFYINSDGERKLLILESDDKFAINLRKALPLSALDDSFKAYTFKLQRKERENSGQNE